MSDVRNFIERPKAENIHLSTDWRGGHDTR